MASDLRVILPNRPGASVNLLKAIADAGINVEGTCGDLRPGETWGYIHILVEDGDAARAVIEGAGFEVGNQMEVDVHQMEDRPGVLLDIVRRYSEEGVNIEVLYVVANNRLVVGTELMRRERPGVRVKDARY